MLSPAPVIPSADGVHRDKESALGLRVNSARHLAYLREDEQSRFLAALGMTGEARSVDFVRFEVCVFSNGFTENPEGVRH